jgi:hypothetical protein
MPWLDLGSNGMGIVCANFSRQDYSLFFLGTHVFMWVRNIFIFAEYSCIIVLLIPRRIPSTGVDEIAQSV